MSPPKNLTTRRGFALACRRWRVAQGGLTMVQAAKRVKVPYRTWQDWEAGLHEPRGIARTLILRRLR